MDALKLLLERASAVKLQDPGPSPEELDTMLRCALRAPDHGRLRPWRFIVISGEDRARFCALLADALKIREPGTTEELLGRERQKALRAPLIIIVAACVKPNEGLRLQASDAIIGIIYVGTPGMAPREMARPELADFVTRWQG